MKTKLFLILISISQISFAQEGHKSIDETIHTLSLHDYTSYFEVTKDMFKMLSESKQTSPEFKEYIGKLHSLKLLEPTGENRVEHGNQLYRAFLTFTNLKDYSRLMTKKEAESSLSFYKKEGKLENEFLLLSTETIIYITGTLDLKSIGEFQHVIEVAGSAFDM